MLSVWDPLGVENDLSALRPRDIELYVRAPLGQPHLQRSDQGGCGTRGDNANDEFRGSAHRPDRAWRLTLAEMSTELRFTAKPILQRLNIAIPAVHSDIQVGHTPTPLVTLHRVPRIRQPEPVLHLHRALGLPVVGYA